MDKWMEVFRAGKHVSASGTQREWTVKDLLHMASDYDPAKHEAPIVVGHPRENGPAYGWIKALKVVGNKLLALPDQVAPEFSELVKAGRYKKRSISLYPDGTLRHVGFLGATAPAVKGLKDINFAGEAGETYEYADTEDADMDELESKDGQEGMDELEKLKQELAEEIRKREAVEDELAKAKEGQEEAAASFAELEARNKRQAIDGFIEQGVKDAKILPAWKARGLADFMTVLDGGAESYEFSEGKKERPLEWFKGFIQSFGEHPLFNKLGAPKDDKKSADFSEDDILGEQIAAKVTPAA